jgi:polyhydroxybutyrate depolymerase
MSGRRTGVVASGLRWLMMLLLIVPVYSGADGPLREWLRERRGETAPSGSASLAPGTHELSVEHGALTRKYLVHVPRSADLRQAVPVVFAFHGGGGDAAYMADDARYGLISKSEQAGFVVVFPNGFSRFPRGRLATWNAGACCGDARDRNIDDVGFVRAMLSDLRKRLKVDPGRIFATGMSNGGMLSHRLACEMADEFAAVAAVAGTDNTLQCAPSRPVAVLHIHARNDDHVLFNGGAGPGAFRDESKVTDFTSVPETIARWTRRDRCAASPMRTLDRPGAWCETYNGCADGVHVGLCVTETGGHSWPGADQVRGGKEPASQAISADDVLWAFFEANHR